MMKMQRVATGLLFSLTLSSASIAGATNYWKNSVVAGDWSNGANWSATSAAGLDDAGAPTAGEAVYIAFTDGMARTVNYDVAAPSIGLLAIDLTGPGATKATLSLPSNFNLTNNGIIVGGSNSVAVTNGRGAVIQSGGTVTTSPVVGDVVLGYGAGSSGVYTLTGGALVNNLDEYIGFSGTGAFNHSGGSNTVNASATGFFSVGHNVGSTGTYNLSGSGTLATNASQNIGNSGTGTFNQTGGTNTISGAGHHLYLGRNTSGVGFYNLSGNAALSSGGDVIVGNNGAGALSIYGQSSVYVTNNLSIKSGSTVDLSGGTLRFNTVGGSAGLNNLFYSSGTIQLAGARTFFDSTITTLYGSTPTISSGKALTIEGVATITTNTVKVNGGSLTSLSSLDVGFQNTSGLEITNGGSVGDIDGSIGGFTANAQSFVTVSGAGSAWNNSGNLSVGRDGGSNPVSSLTVNTGATVFVGQSLAIMNLASLNLQGGTIRFNGYSRAVGTGLTFTAGTVQLAGNRTIGSDAAISDFFGAAPTISTGKALVVEGTATIAATATLSGGTLSADTVLMTPGSRLTSTLPTQVSGVMLALTGSVIDATGASLTLGDAAKVNGFYGSGTIKVGQRTVTLADANDAVLDSAALVTLGAGASPGTLVAANGLTLDFGGNVTGFGTVDTPNSSATPLINNGHITGNIGAPITLAGYVKGVGTLDNVVITGTAAPGFSPATVTLGSVAYNGALEIELGGPSAGSFDRLQHVLGAGVADLGGSLVVSLLGGFAPQLGDSFEFLTAAGGVNGTFASKVLPTLAAGLGWNVNYGVNSVALQVAAVPSFAADFDEDVDVDGDDLVRWRTGFGTGATHMQGDADGDGDVDGADFLTWQRQLGNVAAVTAAAAVPEPASATLLLAAACLALAARTKEST